MSCFLLDVGAEAVPYLVGIGILVLLIKWFFDGLISKLFRLFWKAILFVLGQYTAPDTNSKLGRVNLTIAIAAPLGLVLFWLYFRYF